VTVHEASAAQVHTGHIVMARKKKSDPHATRFGKFLQACIKFSASDLIIKSDQQPKIRLRGALKPLDTEAVSTEEFWQIAAAILDEEQTEDLHKFGSVDFAYDYDDQNRFRVNLFQARGRL
jgi:twitching motility protein PilT